MGEAASGPLSGRVVLVTGGGRGIGRGVATALALSGAEVAVTYRRDKEAAEELVASVRERGGSLVALEASIDDPEASERAVAFVVDTFGSLDALVHNAGVASRGRPVADTELSELSRVLGIHAIGPHQLTRAALPHLRENERSDVVFLSSIATHAWAANGAPYAMGKAALEALAHTLAREERGNGVRVNIVAPGLVDTEMGRRLVRATQGVEDIRSLDETSPFGRVCSPADVAQVVRFLLDPGSGYVNDQRIVVDGGTF